MVGLSIFDFISGQKATKSVLTVCSHEPNLNIKLISLPAGKQALKLLQPNICVIFSALFLSLLNVCAPGEISVHFAPACSMDATDCQEVHHWLHLIIVTASCVESYKAGKPCGERWDDGKILYF